MDLTRVASLHSSINALQFRTAILMVEAAENLLVINAAGTGKSRLMGTVVWIMSLYKKAVRYGRVKASDFPNVLLYDTIYIFSNSVDASKYLEKEIKLIMPDLDMHDDIRMVSINKSSFVPYRDGVVGSDAISYAPGPNDLVIVDEVKFSQKEQLSAADQMLMNLTSNNAKCILVNATPIWNGIDELYVPMGMIGNADRSIQDTSITADNIRRVFKGKTVFVPSVASDARYMSYDFTSGIGKMALANNMFILGTSTKYASVYLPLSDLQRDTCEYLIASGKQATGITEQIMKASFSLDVIHNANEYPPHVEAFLTPHIAIGGIMRPITVPTGGLYLSDISMGMAFALNNETKYHRKAIFYVYYHDKAIKEIKNRMNELHYVEYIGGTANSNTHYYMWCSESEEAEAVSKLSSNISIMVFITSKSAHGMNYLGFLVTYVGYLEYTLSDIEQIIARGIRLSKLANPHEIYILHMKHIRSSITRDISGVDDQDAFIESAYDVRYNYIMGKIPEIADAVDALRDGSICQHLIPAKKDNPLDSFTKDRPQGANYYDVHIYNGPNASAHPGRSFPSDTKYMMKWLPVFSMVEPPNAPVDVKRRCNGDAAYIQMIKQFYDMQV